MRFHWMHRFHGGNSREGVKNMAITLENAGVYSYLLPYGATGPDFLVFVPGMIDATKKIKYMIALRPYALTPEYAAKIFMTFDSNFGKRLMLNVVAGMLVPEEQEYVLKHYTGDPSNIDTMYKRLQLAEDWVQKFYALIKNLKPETFTIANSDYTMEFGNKYFDGVIFDMHRLEANFKQAKGIKKVLVIDPLIIEDGDTHVEYLYEPTNLEKTRKEPVVRQQKHEIAGTYEEVLDKIKEISVKYGIDDFMIVTDQKDITNILRLIKELSN